MGETMEEYMCKTRDDYRSGVTRPKIDDKAHFKLKGQFLKELRDNTFSGSDHEDANEHIEKVLEIEVILFYKGLEVPTRQILDSDGAIPTMTAANARCKFMAESAKRHEENSILIKEIQASMDATIRNQGASIKALEIQIGQKSKALQERRSKNLPSLTKTNPRDHTSQS
nr:hypothetical protein [Tanacetum cinerariifolium]